MRLVTSAITLSILVLTAGQSRADKATVVADCKTAITSSTAAGIGVRVVTGGAIPGMQAYVHEMPSTNSKTHLATLIGALEVKHGVKPDNNTVEVTFVGVDPTSKFQLVVKRQKTTAGAEFTSTATFDKTEVGGKTVESQELVCSVSHQNTNKS
jgi:hypothetical protein